MTGKVFFFEFLNAVRKKSFIISTALMVLLLLLMSFIPKIVQKLTPSAKDQPYGLISDLSYITPETASESTGFPFVRSDSEADMRAAIDKGDLTAGIIYENGQRKLLLKENNLSMAGKTANLMRSLGVLEAREELTHSGVDANKVTAIWEAQRPYETVLVSSAKDGAKSFWIVYVQLFVFYFLILTFGSQVAMAVAREKSDRTMELLITSAKPKDLIRGKVYAYGLVGVLVLGLMLAAGYIGMRISMGGSSMMGEAKDIASQVSKFIQLNITLEQIILGIVYFVLGYILYLYLLASAASLVSRMEDINMAIQPIVLLFVAGFLISMMSLSKPGILLSFASYFPFTSPLAMPARYAVSNVSYAELGISIAVLLATTVLVRIFAVRMYRLGSLNYGTKVNFFKMLFQSIRQ